jgi:periplasmic protein TonB
MDNVMLSNPEVTLEDIVYENRNKEYGSFVLRKKNRKFLFLAFLISLIGLGSGISVPFIKAYRNRGKKVELLSTTVVSMTDVKTAEDIPPPPPPPPPPAAAEQQVKYTAPKVVDTVKEEVQLATVSEVSQTTTNEPVPEKIEVAKEEETAIQEEEPVFIFVEEQASFQNGDVNTFRAWVEKSLVYPPVAAENGIFGKVIVQFAVNSKGDVVDAKVLRSVDPSLDKETIRVINMSPKWVPAKQGGRAVKQQFVIPVSFVLQ